MPMTDTVELTRFDAPPGIRRAATRDVKALGFRYLLINETDYGYDDFKKNLSFWGLTQIAEANETHFYRID